MTAHTKVAGVWQPVTEIHTKVAGVWQPVTTGYTKVAGVWQPFFTAGPVITIPSSWGSNTGASPLTSLTKTFTVTGGPGTIRFASSNAGKYSLNAGAFTNVIDGATLSVSNGNTLAFRFTTAVSDTWTVDVYNDFDNTLVGSWQANV